MEKKDEGRWFLIEHKKDCSSVFTVNSRKFLKSIVDNDDPRGKRKTCPSCSTVIPTTAVESLCDFFAKYESLIESLATAGFNIREIKTNIDFQDSKEKVTSKMG